MSIANCSGLIIREISHKPRTINHEPQTNIKEELIYGQPSTTSSF